MEVTSRELKDSTLFVTGRLVKIAPAHDRVGHRLQARSGECILDSTTTDETGRFLLEWAEDGAGGDVTVQLLGPKDAVAESVVLTRADLDSPPVVNFTGEGVVGYGTSPRGVDRSDRFDADGCAAIYVAPSCQDVTLSWTCPEGTGVSILCDGEDLRTGLPHVGLLRVKDAESHTYTRRAWLPGAPPDQFSDRTVEVRRYPSLSLVTSGKALWPPGVGQFGASTSCPAGEEGLKVSVKSSDPEMVPDFEIAIPPGFAWVTSAVQIGSKKGTVTLTASAPGFARDAVTFSL